jgi:hypothetical protein
MPIKMFLVLTWAAALLFCLAVWMAVIDLISFIIFIW